MTNSPTTAITPADIAATIGTDHRENFKWGRVAQDGTVSVVDPDGSERVIGSWHAGTPAQGLAFYARKYADLAAEVKVLEARVVLPSSDHKAIGASARKLAESLPTAAVIGDLSELAARLGTVLTAVDARKAEIAAAKHATIAGFVERKKALVAEAQKLSGGQAWRAGNDRFRAMVEEWKSIKGIDRATDTALWEEFAAARREFDKRRRAAAASAETERGAAVEKKEALIAQADKLATSTEWADTARKYRDLMTEWKAAGRASRDADDELWTRFKAAQDRFFTARSAVFDARDGEQKQNLEAKVALLDELDAMDVAKDPSGARKALRRLQDRWDAIGKVPRDSMGEIEKRLISVENKLRDAAETGRPQPARSESTLVIRLRESVGKLENRLQRAQTAGDTKLITETETSLTTQREWLAQAESSTGR